MNTNKSTAPSSSTTAELTVVTLLAHNRRFAGTAGVSAGNREQGFRPAFFDTDKGSVHLSRFADGRPAPMHVLDGLPGDRRVARVVTQCRHGASVSGTRTDKGGASIETALRPASA